MSATAAAANRVPRRLNVVLILSDDERVDGTSVMRLHVAATDEEDRGGRG